jgi:uncharacterized membrane protein YkvA (DUF1232 family)
LLKKLKAVGRGLKQELQVYRLVLKDKRTPKMARIILGIAVGYALMPFDIIPDFIPVIGYIDDAVIIPLLLLVALKMVPREVMEDCRARALNSHLGTDN